MEPGPNAAGPAPAPDGIPAERPTAPRSSGFALPNEFGPERPRRDDAYWSDDSYDDDDFEDPLDAPEHQLFTDAAQAARSASGSAATSPHARSGAARHFDPAAGAAPTTGPDEKPDYYDDASGNDNGDDEDDEEGADVGGRGEASFSAEAVGRMLGSGRLLSASSHTSVVLADSHDACLKLMTVPIADGEAGAAVGRALLDGVRSLQRRASEAASRAAAAAVDGQQQEEAALPLLVPHGARMMDDTLVAVLPYVPGGSLADCLAFAQDALTNDAVRAVAAGLVAAVATLHRHGLVHGNLKPGNVLLSPAGELLLCDARGTPTHPLLAADPLLGPDAAEQLLEALDEATAGDDVNAAAAVRRALLAQTSEASLAEQQEAIESVFAASVAAGGIRATCRDDWFAVGAIMASLIAGVPVTHGLSAMRVATTVAARPTELLLRPVDRAAPASQLSSDLINAAREFISFCGAASKRDPDEDEEDEEDFVEHVEQCALVSGVVGSPAVADAVRQLADEAGGAIGRLVASPLLPDGGQAACLSVLRNAVFATRQEALYTQLAAAGTLGDETDSDEGAKGSEPTTPERQKRRGGGGKGVGPMVLCDEEGLACEQRLPPIRRMAASSAEWVPRNAVLARLRACTVAVLDVGGCTVVADVEDSDVTVGPCAAVLLYRVRRSTVRVAAYAVVVEECDDVSLHAVATAPVQVGDSCGGSNLIFGFNVAAPGLSAQFRRVGLPLMTRASDGLGGSAPAQFWHAPHLHAAVCSGHDAPWQLPQLTLRVVSPDENVLILPGDATQRAVIVDGQDGGAPRVVVIVDELRDVTLRALRHCTVVVAAAERLSLDGVVDCDVYAVAGDVALVNCEHVRLSMLADCCAVSHCSDVEVGPLMLQLSGLASLAQDVLQSARWQPPFTDDDQLHESILIGPEVTGLRSFSPPTLVVPLGAEPPQGVAGAPSANPATAHTLSDFCQCHATVIAALQAPAKLLMPGHSLLFPAASSTGDSPRQPPPPQARTLPATAAEAAERTLAIRDVAGGVLHIGDVVGELVVEGCTDGLEIVLLAARRVCVRDCSNVTLHVACRELTVETSLFVTIACFAAEPPVVAANCAGVQICPLNVAADDFEDALALIDIDLDRDANEYAQFGIEPADHDPACSATRPELPVAVLCAPLVSIALSTDPDSNIPFAAAIEDQVTAAEEAAHRGLLGALEDALWRLATPVLGGRDNGAADEDARNTSGPADARSEEHEEAAARAAAAAAEDAADDVDRPQQPTNARDSLNRSQQSEEDRTSPSAGDGDSSSMGEVEEPSQVPSTVPAHDDASYALLGVDDEASAVMEHSGEHHNHPQHASTLTASDASPAPKDDDDTGAANDLSGAPASEPTAAGSSSSATNMSGLSPIDRSGGRGTSVESGAALDASDWREPSASAHAGSDSTHRGRGSATTAAAPPVVAGSGNIMRPPSDDDDDTDTESSSASTHDGDAAHGEDTTGNDPDSDDAHPDDAVNRTAAAIDLSDDEGADDHGKPEDDDDDCGVVLDIDDLPLEPAAPPSAASGAANKPSTAAVDAKDDDDGWAPRATQRPWIALDATTDDGAKAPAGSTRPVIPTITLPSQQRMPPSSLDEPELPSSSERVSASANDGVEEVTSALADMSQVSGYAESLTPRDPPRSLSPLLVRRHRRTTAADSSALTAIAAALPLPMVPKSVVEHAVAKVKAPPGGIARPSRKAADPALETLCADVLRNADRIEQLLRLRAAQREL